MVPKHLRKSSESLGGDQESLMTSLFELQEKIKNDKSILRQPIDTGVRGVKDLIKAVVGGTQELQELLLSECTIIYECKICRNLFRSLVNFISHKRIYCIKKFSYFNQEAKKHENELFEQDGRLNSNLMFSDDINLTKAKIWLTNDKIVPNNIKVEENNYLKPTRRIKISPFKIAGKCDIARIADGLNQKERKEYAVNSNELLASCTNMEIADNLMSKKCQPSFLVDNLNDSSSVNFSQHLERAEYLGCPNSINLQAIDKLHSYNEAILQENGKFRVTPQGMKIEDHENLENKCTICNTHFFSKQILTRHVQIHHKERICYPCPICRTFFPSPSSTYRHLSKDHHKTEQQIRRLRPKVLAKASKRKLVDIQAKNGIEKASTLQTLNGSLDGALSCNICGKVFNRQAVLRVHLISCKEKDSSNNKICSSKPSNSTKLVMPRAILTTSEFGKPEQKKSGILVRRDYCKKIMTSESENMVAKNSNLENFLFKGHSLNRISKWRTVLQKLQSKNDPELNKKTIIEAD